MLGACPGDAGRPPSYDSSLRRDATPRDVSVRDLFPSSQDRGAPDLVPPRDSKPATPDLPKGCAITETLFGGRCYWAPGIGKMSYASAKQLCTQTGGQVASIGTAAEDQFVYGLLPATSQAAWIGLRRSGASFSWESGEPLAYTNWATGEPNNSAGTEDCVLIWGPALGNAALRTKWNDAPCDTPGRDSVICERAP